MSHLWHEFDDSHNIDQYFLIDDVEPLFIEYICTINIGYFDKFIANLIQILVERFVHKSV